jgi:hypothetical protein
LLFVTRFGNISPFWEKTIQIKTEFSYLVCLISTCIKSTFILRRKFLLSKIFVHFDCFFRNLSGHTVASVCHLEVLL